MTVREKLVQSCVDARKAWDDVEEVCADANKARDDAGKAWDDAIMALRVYDEAHYWEAAK